MTRTIDQIVAEANVTEPELRAEIVSRLLERTSGELAQEAALTDGFLFRVVYTNERTGKTVETIRQSWERTIEYARAVRTFGQTATIVVAERRGA